MFRSDAANQHDDQSSTLRRVWDLPLRLFHWGLAVCFGFAWLTTGDRWLDFHVFTGYLLGGLLLFRLYWGLYGEPNARFRDFAFGWRTVRGYLVTVLRGGSARYLGHNPAGSWAIWLILVLLLSLVVTGVLTLGSEERHGPFAGWSDFSTGAVLHRMHEILAWGMVGIVAVHLLGVLVESLLHRENLVAAMVTGNKRWPGSTPSVRTRSGVATLLLLFPLLFAIGRFKGYLLQTQDRPYLPFIGPELADNSSWREGCGECHLAYHPSLLPARSWARMMEQQVDHFGEDLALEPVDAKAILDFQIANSAERAATEAAWKINRGILRGQTPLRITETGYWKRKHREIDPAVWDSPAVNGRWNCDACHLDADRGTFEDGAMMIPD